jgi:hypothetical protein
MLKLIVVNDPMPFTVIRLSAQQVGFPNLPQASQLGALADIAGLIVSLGPAAGAAGHSDH